jgi:hypothetical protein
MSLYMKDGKQPISKQVKRGLSWALKKFSEYSIAKYRGEGKNWSLRDVMFLCHPKPRSDGDKLIQTPQEQLYKRIADNELVTPDTWEVALSSGADKKETFTRLIRENKLGYLALLRNLRNLYTAGVDFGLVEKAIRARANGADKVLPFRFIAAARHAPQWVSAIDDAMQATMEGLPKLEGRTIVLVDNSGSMYGPTVSAKSELLRADAAQGVAIIARGICDNTRVFAFSDALAEVPAYKGLALAEKINWATSHSSTYLGKAVSMLNAIPYDRLIVITDEQSYDPVPNPRPGAKGYMLNVASTANGVARDSWVRINGWSDAVIRYIIELERIEQLETARG